MMPDGADPRLQLTPTQHGLFEVLVDKRGLVGDWYRAAIAVINDASLPDRLSFAAHALREVMEKLPGDGVRMDRAKELPAKVRDLQPSWKRACEHYGDARWDGSIAEPLRAFLVVMEEFFDGQEQLTRTRRDFAFEFLKTLEVVPAGLPEDVQRENARHWVAFHRYFDGVAHHGTVDEAGFRDQVSRLESFLSARLMPRPTQDFTRIDLLVQEE